MRRRLFVLLVSLLPMYCIGQLAITDLTAMVLSGTDTGMLVQDLTHTIKETSKVVLSWKVKDTSAADFVSVERCSNGGVFEAMAILKVHESGVFEWVDDAAPKGKNYYRISLTSKDGEATIKSKALTVTLAGLPSIRFYPNPVDNILIIRTDTPVEVQIADQAGKVRVPSTQVKGLHTLNLSFLEKGVYILRIFNRVSNAVIQEKLIKN